VLTNIVATHARESEHNNNNNNKNNHNENNNLMSSDKNVAATKWLIGIGKQSAIVVIVI